MLQRPCPAEADNRVDYKGLGYDGRRHGQDQSGERGRLALIGRNADVAFAGAVLHLDRAAHGINYAAKLNDASVAGAFDHATVMHGTICRSPTHAGMNRLRSCYRQVEPERTR